MVLVRFIRKKEQHSELQGGWSGEDCHFIHFVDKSEGVTNAPQKKG
jgi:hypothetical protein